jgi:hypothetical protein|tara:strand:+ start:1190 stop:1834 length:645 start_codon:yes stop_codon:yes gene_type:complete
MTLRLKGSSSGDVSIAAPAAAGDNTITLPTSNGSADQFLMNSGTAGELEFASLASSDMPTGSILQVVQALKTDADSFSLATVTESSNIIQQSITVAASSKVLIMCTMHMMATTPSYGFTFNRGGTSIGIGDVDGSRFRATAVGYSDPDRQDSTQPLNAMFLDTPGSAGTYTYGVKVRHSSSATQTLFINLYENDSNVSKLMRPISHFTLMEVAG